MYARGYHGECFDCGETRDLILESLEKDGQAVAQLVTQTVTKVRYYLTPVHKRSKHTTLEYEWEHSSNCYYHKSMLSHLLILIHPNAEKYYYVLRIGPNSSPPLV